LNFFALSSNVMNFSLSFSTDPPKSSRLARPEEMTDEDAKDEAGRAGKPRVVLGPVHESITDGQVIQRAKHSIDDRKDKDSADAKHADHNDADLDENHG
jgi:hypothetical protein